MAACRTAGLAVGGQPSSSKTSSSPSMSSIWTPTWRKPNLARTIASEATLSGATDARKRSTPCSRAAPSRTAPGRPRSRLPGAGTRARPGSRPRPGRRRRAGVEPARPDDPARAVRLGQHDRPAEPRLRRADRATGRRSGTARKFRAVGQVGRHGRADLVLRRGEVAATSACMNGSDIETSSKRGVRIAETAGTGASSHRGSAGERDTVGEHVSSLKDPMDSPAVTPVTDIPLRERLLAWKEILETANPPASRPLDTVGKWLVITRAAVFPMTIWSGLIGGLLAVEANRVSGGAAGRLGSVPAGGRRARARARRQQHDQRLLRHDRWRRHRGLRPGALRAAPDPVGLGHQAPARGRDPRRQRDRGRDHARASPPSAGR